jgi:hypothetical protein
MKTALLLTCALVSAVPTAHAQTWVGSNYQDAIREQQQIELMQQQVQEMQRQADVYRRMQGDSQ